MRAGLFEEMLKLWACNGRCRRAANEAAAQVDVAGLRMVAVLWLFVVVLKTAVQERLPWAALRFSLHSVFAQGLACLAVRRRSTYAKYRGLLTTLFSVHCTIVSLDGALNGGTNILRSHSGMPLKLLALLCVYNSGIWTALYSLFTRHPASYHAMRLPLLALVPLLGTRRLCHRLLEAPGSEVPLASLYRWLNLAHAPVVSISPLQMWHTPVPDDLESCMAVSLWSQLALQGLLPLVLLARWESPAGAAAGQRGSGSERAADGAHLKPAQLYLASCVLWFGAMCATAVL